MSRTGAGAQGSAARCPDCDAALVVTALSLARAASGPVEVTIEPRRARVCPRRSEGRCPGRRSDALLDAALTSAIEQRSVAAAGSPRAGRCGDCGSDLDLPMRATTRPVTVEPNGDPPFTLTLAVPVVRCGDCGVDNLPPGIVDDVLGAARTACGLDTSRGRGWVGRLSSRLRHGERGYRARP